MGTEQWASASEASPSSRYPTQPSTNWLWLSKPMGSHFGVGTHFRTYFSGDWDVHWGYDLDFHPWPTHDLKGAVELVLGIFTYALQGSRR